MRILRLAIVVAFAVTALGAALFYENVTPSLYMPGCLINSMATGGGVMHASGVGWTLGSLIFNFFVYAAVSYWLIWMVLTLAGRNVVSTKK